MFKPACFVLVVSCFVLAALAKDMPPIPCTFSTHYREVMKYRASGKSGLSPAHESLLRKSSNILRGNGLTEEGDYDVELDWYSIEDKYASQVQDNVTLTQKMPYTWTLISPFFERKVAVRFDSKEIPSIHCPEFPDGAKYQGTDTCPYDKRYKCDWFQWWSYDLEMYQSAYFIPERNNALDMIVIENEEYLLEEYFINMSLDTPPLSRFEVPKDQPLTDLTTDPKSEPMWRSSKSVGDKARSEHGKLSLLPPHLFRSRNDPVRRPYEPFRPNFNRKASIPDSFDAREKYPKCGTIRAIRNQEKCGSCWAFGAAEAFGDRYCIKTAANITFSPQYLVDCYKMNDGCEGGTLDDTWKALVTQGIVSDQCYPYKAQTGKCGTRCEDGSEMRIVKAKNAYSPYVPFQAAENVRMIQQEILDNGPLEAAFYVLDDFYNYAGGVYTRSKGATYRGGHAIKVIGWGSDPKTKVPYWLIANSWGEDWGEKGFFRIRRGTDECGIESQMTGGIILA